MHCIIVDTLRLIKYSVQTIWVHTFDVHFSCDFASALARKVNLVVCRRSLTASFWNLLTPARRMKGKIGSCKSRNFHFKERKSFLTLQIIINFPDSLNKIWKEEEVLRSHSEQVYICSTIPVKTLKSRHTFERQWDWGCSWPEGAVVTKIWSTWRGISYLGSGGFEIHAKKFLF